VWGLPITAVPQMLDSELMRVIRQGASDHTKIVIGCVDNAAARNTIAVHTPSGQVTIDCGNAEHDGQVAVGTTNNPAHLRGCLQLGSVARALPSPYLVYPNLLEEPVAPPVDADCAAAVQAQRQGLNVNQIVADIAVQYVTALVLERRITTFRTQVDIRALSMRSWPITPSALAEATGYPATLFTEPTDSN
jgi:hypothetical protein